MHDVLTASSDCCLSRPPPMFPCRPDPTVNKHSSSLQRKSSTRASADPIAWLRSLRTTTRVIAAIAPFVGQIATSTAVESRARAQAVTRSESIDRFAKSSTKHPIVSPSRQACLLPITPVRRGINSTSQQANGFRRKPQPTLRQSRNCSVMCRANTPHFASDMQFLGGKLSRLSSA
jgi:hypothetical protein